MLLYPHKLLQYVRKKLVVNGVDYAWSRKPATGVHAGFNDVMVGGRWDMRRSRVSCCWIRCTTTPAGPSVRISGFY